MKYWVGLGQYAKSQHRVIEAESMADAVSAFVDDWVGSLDVYPPFETNETVYVREIGSIEWSKTVVQVVFSMTVTMAPPAKMEGA